MKRTFIPLALAFVLTGCLQSGDDSSPTPSDSELRGGPESVAELVDLHDLALFERDILLYDKILTSDFEFFPRGEDLAEFPWIDGSSWNKAEEVKMLGNMFDPEFSGELPALKFFVERTTVGEEAVVGGTEVTIDVTFTILQTPSEGFLMTTRLVIFAVAVGDSYQIRSIRETDAFVPRRDETNWAPIKALYRS